MNNPEKRILLFGGTTEGRICAEKLIEEGIPCTVCVATAYGEQMMQPDPLLTVHTGRMDREAMEVLMLAGSFAYVIDATHPHAQIVTKEILAATEKTGLPYLRLQRDLGMTEKDSAKSFIRVSNTSEAGAFLSGTEGTILVTTGSKELEELVHALGDASRIVARVLPAQASLEACAQAGLTGKQIVAMQGPFDTEMNCALIRHAGAVWLLTKETGETGGYPEKIEAAKKCGIGVVSICAPQEKENGNKLPGMSLEQVMKKVREALCIPRELALVGIGVGAAEVRTREAEEALAEAQVLFGAESVLRMIEKDVYKNDVNKDGKVFVPVYDSESILQYLCEHTEVRKAAAVYSGDSGFYSGASSMLSRIRKVQGELPGSECPKEQGGLPGSTFREDDLNLQLRVICGISCVSYFAAKIGFPWQDWKILSSHGRRCNVVGQVRRNEKCFLLLSGAEDVRKTGAALMEAQKAGVLGALRVICGYELSRPEEEIRCYELSQQEERISSGQQSQQEEENHSCEAEELCAVEKNGLYVLYIEHEKAKELPILPGLLDSAFLRGKVPMTSSEIRSLSLCRLGLTAQAVIWDIGAGTGSVSVEAALTCPEGQVYAVEHKEEALKLLRENRAKFCLENMEIIEGFAPEALKGLPAPTHVFIGGSGGEIGKILRVVLDRSPYARVVINCITAETLEALQLVLPVLPITDVQCTQVSVQRGEKLGRYHYLKALNPVFIISFRGK